MSLKFRLFIAITSLCLLAAYSVLCFGQSADEPMVTIKERDLIMLVKAAEASSPEWIRATDIRL